MLGHILVHLVAGETKAGQFFGAAMILLFALALPVASALGLAALAWGELAQESSYRQRYGAEWKLRYEEHQGSLTEARVKVATEIVGAVVVTGIGIWLYTMILPALRGEGYAASSRGRSRRKRKRSARRPQTQVQSTATVTTLAPVTVSAPPGAAAPPRISRPSE